MFHIAICDDEEYFRFREQELIEKYMEKRGYVCQVDLYPSGKSLLGAADALLRYDMIFLDISMEEIDGMETARRIRQMSDAVYIVFVTAYITYAIEGYKVDAVRYLLKEDSGIENALQECLDAIVERMDYDKMTYRLEVCGGKKNIFAHSVLYVESRLHKVIFWVMEDGVREYSMYNKLDTVELELQQYGFCRTHQSFLVNMKYATGVERYKVTLKNEIEVGISKKYYKSVELEFIRRQGEI